MPNKTIPVNVLELAAFLVMLAHESMSDPEATRAAFAQAEFMIAAIQKPKTFTAGS